MKITLTGIPVTDQGHALSIYTEKLGFEKKEDVAMGEHRWLTVISPEGVKGVELLLEPLEFEPAKEYYAKLYESGIPVAQFESEDLEAEVERLKKEGIVFRGGSQEMGDIKFVIFEDSCGNLICLTQKVQAG